MTRLFEAAEGAAVVARRYIQAYCDKDFATIRALLDTALFRFSHHSRGAYAEDADAFLALVERMAAEVFPDRRFTHIHGLHVIDDVVLVDAEWKGTPIITVPGKFEAGVERTMKLKSLIMVANGLITEIRDHDS